MNSGMNLGFEIVLKAKRTYVMRKVGIHQDDEVAGTFWQTVNVGAAETEFTWASV